MNASTDVHQGCILGPVMFLLLNFVNDIKCHIHFGTCNQYADDCLVYCTVRDVHEVDENSLGCTDRVEGWYNGEKKKNQSLMLTNVM